MDYVDDAKESAKTCGNNMTLEACVSVIGGVIGFILIATLIWYYFCKYRPRKRAERRDTTEADAEEKQRKRDEALKSKGAELAMAHHQSRILASITGLENKRASELAV
ncbi:hypothetical protein BD324DRAFT_651074 [Kockovaella imperatae]|uniref:Uncharacterized protein n=1 Tax=Kockovaella imperatae TaxID=4999 RepID=A0A1Y1UGE7_9TREE|nr:hypothetical protein BD324DRAFT_651074 [Kockovaella imperatae]ORX36584.1 hypothetical protein BD324DRAFT_651074 [Kockovaella imperatae]